MGSIYKEFEEYPPLASLQRDVYRPLPQSTKLPKIGEIERAILVNKTLQSLAEGLEESNISKVKACFLSSQSYWRDLLAFTYHFRTFNDGAVIAPALVELKGRRGLVDGFHVLSESIRCVPATPTLHWVQAMFTFRTETPAALCGGTVCLLPEETSDGLVWKIWNLATWIDEFELHPEDEGALKTPARRLEEVEDIKTDVLIIGGGNAGLIQAARLKALKVDCVVIDRNEQPGDNWALRYDCLRFHVSKSVCETPYLPYPKDDPMVLTRPMLVKQMKRYAEALKINLLNSSTVEASSFNESTDTWLFKIRTPWGQKMVTSKHVVQATGIGCTKPFIPIIPDNHSGISMHSSQYRNPWELKKLGVKSAIIVGSANSGFDIMEDCAKAGLETTIVARSPTYIFPWDYSLDPGGLGMYEVLPTELVDKLTMTGPWSIAGQIMVDQAAALASKEPNRYQALAEAGFPVFDSLHGGDLLHNLFERAGGHFNEIGDGIELIVSGTVAVKGNVQPTELTTTGMKFSDGSVLDADAIIWCTGFADKNREVTAEIFGQRLVIEGDNQKDSVLGPEEIASRRDGIWGVDNEGEIRGMWKRHLRVKNYWVTGAGTSHHRYYSRPLALQIKASVEGFLPDAYRDLPGAV
ncbi:hypothetical protein N7486_011348 [Penicillium sp. IBT 16267x]|nr:hypothetical protein N7486_011348 [Penicillium sp. IBT 16267x]